MDIFQGLGEVIENFQKREYNYDPYYFWEPWDCLEPDMDMRIKAVEDGIDIDGDEVSKLDGEYPRKFQSGMVLSKKRYAVIQAGSRVGKTITNQILLGASISKRPPYCLCYKEGEDTGIKRMVTPINIRRFGRRDAKTGEIIDYDHTAEIRAETLNEWDCGNITGIGLFPEELYTPDGGQIWIGTLPAAKDTLWWPSMAGTGEQRFIPQEFLDTSKGNNGTNKSLYITHYMRDVTVYIKSYDSKRDTFESKKAHLILWDEEPKKAELFASGSGHGKYHRFSFTPFNGMSWSKGLFFGCINTESKLIGESQGIGALKQNEFDFFHASQFDSPYVDREELESNRNTFPMHERKSLIWGRYSEHVGQPFYDRSKILLWERRFSHHYKAVKFIPDRQYHGIDRDRGVGLPCLFNINVKTEVAEENMRDVWRMYEPVIKGVGYLGIFDAAEGAIDPLEVQDKSFGLMVRSPMASDPIEHSDHPIIVASTRSTLPIVSFARSVYPVLRYYNNAVLASERGHGKDNEAFGLTMDDWPYWYYYQSRNDTTKRLHKRRGFDTNALTRTVMFDYIRDWLDEYSAEEDPMIRDRWLFGELAGAITKETRAGKRRCDHTKRGSLDGVICMGIASYIFREQPEVIVCNHFAEENKRQGLLQRLGLFPQGDEETDGHIAIGAGVASMGRRH